MEDRIKRALLSVSNKQGITGFARGLRDLDIELIATGGTRKLLMDEGIAVRSVEEITSSPEMMGGRVKTLHPRILGGILARRDVPGDVEDAQKHDIPFIDLVAVNLYPFQEKIIRDPDDLDGSIEEIDIGGPTMVRAAAKNFKDVAIIVDPARYESILEELRTNGGALSRETLLSLAVRAFRHVALYNSVIARHLNAFVPANDEVFPDEVVIPFVKGMKLRYGENPHQRAAFYRDPVSGKGWTARFTQLWGKELSTNNILDADSAWRLISDLGATSCAILKHNNPCGVGTGSNLEDAYRRALQTDPISAFGGIVAVNLPVDEATAALLSKHFFEVIMAPDYEDAALTLLEKKKNLRLLKISPAPDVTSSGCPVDIKSVEDGAVFQERDMKKLDPDLVKVATRKQPTESQRRALEFAWVVAKHVKSNAIVLSNELGTIGIGAGQMSRVDSVRISVEKAGIAGLPTDGSVLASDAFFPFRDGIDEAAAAGVKAVIQPGGSIRDEEVIKAADEHGIAMVLTGMRHFRH